MRSLILGVGLSLALAAPALAQNAGQDPSQNPSQSENQSSEQGTTPQQSASAIQQQVRHNLAAAGYTDIQVMPRSFLVRAKDKSGNPTLMIINPNSVTAVKTLGGTNAASNAATREPVELSSAQKRTIQQIVADQPTEQAPPDFQPSVGEKVPSNVALKSFPSSASSQVPASLQGDQFAKLNDNNIIIADPSSREVVAVINQQSSEQ